jgi:hypothetical protein
MHFTESISGTILLLQSSDTTPRHKEHQPGQPIKLKNRAKMADLQNSTLEWSNQGCSSLH